MCRFRLRRPVIPYDKPQLASITQTSQQQQGSYQPAWPPPPVEQPPPPYYIAMDPTMIPPSMSYEKM